MVTRRLQLQVTVWLRTFRCLVISFVLVAACICELQNFSKNGMMTIVPNKNNCIKIAPYCCAVHLVVRGFYMRQVLTSDSRTRSRTMVF